MRSTIVKRFGRLDCSCADCTAGWKEGAKERSQVGRAAGVLHATDVSLISQGYLAWFMTSLGVGEDCSISPGTSRPRRSEERP